MNRREFIRNAASGLFLMKAAPIIFDYGYKAYQQNNLIRLSEATDADLLALMRGHYHQGYFSPPLSEDMIESYKRGRWIKFVI